MAINPEAPKFPEVDIALLNGGDPNAVPATGPSYSDPNFGIPQEIYNPELDIVLLPGVPTQRGPTGPQGPPGDLTEVYAAIPSLVSYTHNQASVSTTWTITHNLNFRPNVMVFDSANTMVEGSITHISNNQLSVSFSAGISGTAYLS